MRYNKSEIMKSAHRNYKRGGMTFSEALKRAWRFAKLQASLAGFEEKSVARFNKKQEKYKTLELNTSSSFNSLDLDWGNVYNSSSRGYMGSQYCGD